MKARICKEIEEFELKTTKLSAKYECEEVSEYIWKIAPKSYDRFMMQDKQFALTILGITHGNEVAGLAVVNQLLNLLASDLLKLEIPILIGLGNPDAARENVRFLEKDLNRCFLNEDQTTKEGKRARVLESFLSETKYLLDFHQTTRKCEEPFFIFPFSKEGFQFARYIDPATPIVTRWSGGFSAEGGCTDEFVNENGGFGISYELGQNGFDDYQIALGVRAALWAIQYATAKHLERELRDLQSESKIGNVYTFAKTVAFPKQGLPILDQGLYNFKDIIKGEKIGELDGNPLLAEESGKILFPKFVDKETDLSVRPAELYRILKAISVKEIPGF